MYGVGRECVWFLAAPIRGVLLTGPWKALIQV